MFCGVSVGTTSRRRVSDSVSSLFEKRVHSAFTAFFTVFFAFSRMEGESLPFSPQFTASSSSAPMSSLARFSTAVTVLFSRFGSWVFSSSVSTCFSLFGLTCFRASISSCRVVSGFSSSEG